MKINTQYISTKNTYAGQNNPKYIVIHETDNWSNGAGAQRHASAQAAGHLSTSVHYYSGSDGVYQAANHNDGTYSVGHEYGGSHSVKDANNRNTINIEICVNVDGDYNVARTNAIHLTRHLMQETGIQADCVIRHFDAKGKYCPRRMMDTPSLWEDFKSQIGSQTVNNTVVDKNTDERWYRVGTSWENGICKNQIGAYHILDNAKHDCKPGYNVYDENGTILYSDGNGNVNTVKQLTGTVITNESSLRIRNTPNGTQIGSIPYAATVTILEKGDEWHKVQYAGIIGYSSAKYIGINESSAPSVSTTPNKQKPVTCNYVVGNTYTLLSEMKVRTGPGTNYRAKKYDELTVSGRKYDKDRDGALDKGTKVTCKDIKTVGNDIWLLAPSGWIAAVYSGNVYVK